MLIANLRKARTRLLASLNGLSDEQLNQMPTGHARSVGGIIAHLCDTEKSLAATILEALPRPSDPVMDRDLSGLVGDYENATGAPTAKAGTWTMPDVIRALEEARFKYLQYVFNKTHETVLVVQSVDHPVFGRVSLKNLVDFIWIHETYHARQIEDLKAQLVGQRAPAGTDQPVAEDKARHDERARSQRA